MRPALPMARREGRPRGRANQPMKYARAPFWTGIAAAAGASVLLAGCKPAAQGSGKPGAGGELYQPQLTPHFQAGEAFKYEATASLDSDMRVIVLNQDAGAGAAPANVSGGAAAAQPMANVAKEEHESYAVQMVADGLARSVYPNAT